MEGFTGFTKAITIAAGQTSSVSFMTASGVNIDCNRAYFTVSDGTVTSGVMIFIPSGVLSYTNLNGNSIPSGLNGSGLYGYHFVASLDVTFGHGRRIKGGNLYNNSPVTRTVVVTYGVGHDINPMSTYRLGIPL